MTDNAKKAVKKSTKRYTKKKLQNILDEYQQPVLSLIYDKEKLEKSLEKLKNNLTESVIRFEKLEEVPMLVEMIRDDFNNKYSGASTDTIIRIMSVLMYIMDCKGLLDETIRQEHVVDSSALVKFVEKEAKDDIEAYSIWAKWVKPGIYPIIPMQILDTKETKSIDELTARYEKLIEPSRIGKTADKLKDKVPDKVKGIIEDAGHAVEEAEIYKKVMELAVDGFDILVKNAAKVSVNETDVIEQINKTMKDNHIFTLDEVCYARGYDIQKIVSRFKTQNVLVAFAEGGATGAAGLAGIPLNLASSLFIFYRAVQSIAMYYGYDVKNSAEEMEIATSVFMEAMDPGKGSSTEIGDMIAKVMTMSEALVVKEVAGKGWTAMAEHGGLCLLITQIRALAHSAAKKALINANKKGLEPKMFEGILKALGKKLSQDAVKKFATPAAAAVTALMDVSTMNKVLEYADIFYNKRFVLEKQTRIEICDDPELAKDVDFDVLEEVQEIVN